MKFSAAKFPAAKTARFAVAGGVAAASVLLLAGPASAHVGVSAAGEAAKGGSAIINFKVPNERDDATTTKVEVNIPADHPLASVMPEPIPGWKIDIVKTKLAKPIDLHGSPVNEAVSKVTWTADAKSSIPAGQFQLFPLSVSPLPTDTDQLVFKAIQTYSNKEVVRWIEEPKEGAAEPENPAPVLKLTAAAPEDGHGGAADSKASDTAAKQDDTKAGTTAASSDSDSSDNLARVLGIVGIVVGIAGVAFGVLAGRRRTA
ncbi:MULTISPECIES: YcnI family copper-binding membrane protein [unclassified Streptomyces]|uniref:YcnI family copper-binding membrane protein n=1 Tax=unclassified Streptomyces TaxID=2593676 RepID=UPI0005A6D2EE|nr:YcnI family protein [Streptomyces sp. NBC_00370]